MGFAHKRRRLHILPPFPSSSRDFAPTNFLRRPGFGLVACILIGPIAVHRSSHRYTFQSPRMEFSHHRQRSASPDIPGTSAPTPCASPSHSPSPRDQESKENERRRANSIAAQKYRRTRVSKVAKFERAVQQITTEKDDLKWKLAAAEREIQVLREMLPATRGRSLSDQ